MTAAVRIQVREQIGLSVVVHTAEGATFDECLQALHVLRKTNRPQPSASGATMYRGLGGLTEPQ